MRVKVKLNELRDAKVNFISLVDRAATRIPFRVQKRNNEEMDMRDLNSLFMGKTKKAEAKPVEVASVVVFAQKTDVATDKVRQSIATAGFTTDKVQKAESGETVAYAQGDGKDTVLIRLSDQTVVSVKGMPEASGMFKAMIAENGFYPGMAMAADAMYERATAHVAKGETTKVAEVVADFSAYVQLLASLPSAVFKMDAAVNATVEAFTPEELGDVKKAEEKKDEPATKDEPAKKEDVLVQKCGYSKEALVSKGMSEEEAETYMKLHDKVAKADEPAKKEETPDAMKGVLDAIAALKTDVSAQVAAVSGEVKAVATKVETAVQQQTEMGKRIDAVAQKADSVESTLKNTVTAPATPEDKPAADAVKKADTHEFLTDTAFQRRGARGWSAR